jgi:Zn finger protein HypA/HybF involved in hydrogenase expression
MLPVEQTCPKCHNRFIGSDMIGFPCPDCLGHKFDITLGTTAFNQEDETDGKPRN